MTAPTFTEHSDVIFDQDKPILGSTALETRDNLESVARGGDGAHRIALLALERLTAGDDIRSRYDGLIIPVDGTSPYVDVHSFAFIQIGTIRVSAIAVTRGAGSLNRISRVRNGTTTIVVAASSSDLSADISVIPGDLLTVEAQAHPTIEQTFNARFSTGGEDLWPGSAARLEGNDVS